jgi:hypothetical protein
MMNRTNSESPIRVRDAMAPECGNDIEMTRALTSLMRLLIVIVLAVAATSLATTRTVNAAMNPAPVPLMLVRINETSTVYVVSTSSYFDPAHPSACDPQDCYLLKRTTNNGASFTLLNLPPVSYQKNSIAGNLVNLEFANSLDGYALLREGVFLTLYVTLDGAASWHRQSIARGEQILALVADRNQLFALIAHCANNHTCTDLRQARSTPAARTWTVATLPRTFPHSFYQNYFGIAAYGPNVWATIQGPKSPVVYTSHDQGRTFTVSLAPSLGSVTACSLTADSARALWAQCPTGMMVSFFHSGDAGVHWTNIDHRGYSGTGGGYFDPVSGSLAYLDYGQTGPSRPKNLFRITNAGRVSTPAGVLRCNDVFGLVFTDLHHGLAICSQGYTLASTDLLRTSDAGATWRRVTAFYQRF